MSQQRTYKNGSDDTVARRGITLQQAKKIRMDNGIQETNLQKIRVKRGLTQKDLSEKSGVQLRAIQCYEQQHRDINGAKLETLCDLSITLQCKIEDILESKDLVDKYKSVK